MGHNGFIAAAMRPGVEELRRRGIPPGFGVGLHYFVLAAGVGVLLWQVVPRVIDQWTRRSATFRARRARPPGSSRKS